MGLGREVWKSVRRGSVELVTRPDDAPSDVIEQEDRQEADTGHRIEITER